MHYELRIFLDPFLGIAGEVDISLDLIKHAIHLSTIGSAAVRLASTDLIQAVVIAHPGPITKGEVAAIRVRKPQTSVRFLKLMNSIHLGAFMLAVCGR